MRPLLWLPAGLFRACVVALGLVAVPVMLACRERPRWLWRPWIDPTGIPGWYWPYAAQHWLAKHFPRWWWLAIRNPANGLRTYPWLSCDVDMTRLEWRDNGQPTNPGPLRARGKRVGWFYAWQGVYSGLWLCVLWTKTRHMKVRIGWKLVPDEAQFIDEWRPERAGFAAAVIPWRRG